LGRYIKAGAHVDLLGGYRSDMQEADGEVMSQARIFVDDRTNALLSGDLLIPINQGTISAESIEADFYELCQSRTFMRKKEDVMVYKNAGGAHINLAVSIMAIKLLMEQQ